MNSGETFSRVEYHLELYGPGDARTPVLFCRTEAPFLPFHKGDLINPHNFEDVNLDITMDDVLRVIGVEHIIWEIKGSHFAHKVMVYTETVANTPETRLGGDQ